MLAIDPRAADHIIAGTGDGNLYRSRNGGRIWRHLSPGIAAGGFSVTVIHFDIERPGTIYVGVRAVSEIGERISGGALYRSEDDGQTWHELEGLHGRVVRGLSQSPGNARILAVAALDGIYLSPDRGQSWRRITPDSHPDLRNFHSVAIDPRHAEVIYAGTSHLPWKTRNSGESWQRAGSAATGMIDDSDIFSIRIDPATPETVLMSACSGIYRSLDGSTKWSKLQGIPFSSRRTHTVYPHPTRQSTILAGTTEGLWISRDGGKAESWRRVTPANLVINAIGIHPEKPDRIILGTEDGGVMISIDGGTTFEPANDGFVSRQITTLLADRAERDHVYAGIVFDGESSGFFRSVDGGMTWRQSMSGMDGRDVYSLHQSSGDPRLIYAGTNEGIFRSDNRGDTWSKVIREPMPVKPLPAIRQPRPGTKPAVQQRPLGSTKPTQRQIKKAPERPAAVDLDNHVTAIASLFPSGSAHGSENPPERPWLIAATLDGLFLAKDEKQGWQRLSLTWEAGRRSSIRALATSPRTPGLLMVGTEDGLFISNDNGTSFRLSLLDEERRRVRCIVIDPHNASRIYVGTTTGFFRSNDAGVTWEQRGGGMPLHTDVSALRLNDSAPDELWLADDLREALFFSKDGGTNWEKVELRELPNRLTRAIATDPFNPARLFVGSFSSGIYVLNR